LIIANLSSASPASTGLRAFPARHPLKVGQGTGTISKSGETIQPDPTSQGTMSYDGFVAFTWFCMAFLAFCGVYQKGVLDRFRSFRWFNFAPVYRTGKGLINLSVVLVCNV
jgi:hypothetical protein